MKHGSEYAKRVKRLYNQMLRKLGKPAEPELVDPIEQLIVGILSSCASHSKALSVFRRLQQQMVDLNELRVTPPSELAEAIGDSLPLAKQKAHRIVDALNAIRKRQDSLDLSFLKHRGRREAREYLESLEGVDSATAASVLLYSLGGHAIPIDDLTLYVLQKEEIVESSASTAEVQTFLERHVPANQAKVFSELLSRYVTTKGARVDVEKLPDLLRPPPPPPPPVPVNTNHKKASRPPEVLQPKTAPKAAAMPVPKKAPVPAAKPVKVAVAAKAKAAPPSPKRNPVKKKK
jgi:endonuclease III